MVNRAPTVGLPEDMGRSTHIDNAQLKNRRDKARMLQKTMHNSSHICRERRVPNDQQIPQPPGQANRRVRQARFYDPSLNPVTSTALSVLRGPALAPSLWSGSQDLLSSQQEKKKGHTERGQLG